MLADNDEIPQCLQGEYRLEFEQTALELLKDSDGVLIRAALSCVTGINQR